jgi:hypothetical protein
MFRYNTGNFLEYYDGTTWQQLSYAAGSVTSFKLDDLSAVPIYTTSPTVSTTGVIQATMTLSTQAPNSVFAGPNSGVTPLEPTFRSLVALDIPPVTNVAGGTTGDILYQSALDTTTFLSPGTAGYVVTSNGPGNAPSYTAVVNSFSTGSSGLTVNASTGNVSVNGGQLVVGYGGTGLSSLTLNGVVYGNATAAAGVTAAGVQYNVLTVNALGVPEFGTLDLAQTGTAVTGILPLANGGTNADNSGIINNGSIMYNNGTQIVNSTVGSSNSALLSTGAGAPTWLAVSSTLTTNQILQGDGTGAFTANGGTYVGSLSYSGVTLQGKVTNATDATTKAYVDAAVAGLNIHGAVETTDTGSEITGAVGLSYTAGVAGSSPDAGTGVGAFLSGTGTLPIIGGYTLTTAGQRILIKQFADGIYSLGTITPGSGYDSGGTNTYTNVPLTGGTGAGAQATIVVTSGAVTAVTVTNNGSAYSMGDVLSASNADLGGSGAGFSIPIDSLQCMQNGIYDVTTLAPNWRLTRAFDYDNSIYGDVKAGDFVFVTEGLAKNTGWVQVTVGSQMPGDITKVGTDEIDFTQFSGAGTYTAGAGLSLASGTQFNVKTDGTTTYIDGSNNVAVKSSSTVDQVLLSNGAGNTAIWGAVPLNNSNAVTGILGTPNGGTGLDTSLATNGQLLIGNGTGLSLATLTQGTGIGISDGAGTITISNTGVTTFSAGSTGLLPNSATSGGISLSGTLVVGNGGTGVTSLTTNGVLYGGSTVGVTAVGATGEILIGNTGAAPSWSTLSSKAVTSFVTTLAGLTPNIAATGIVSLDGTLGITSGGTGAITPVTAFDNLAPTTTLGDLIYNNGTSNVRLPIAPNPDGYLLTIVTGEPTWQAPPATGVTSWSGGLTGLLPNSPTIGPVVLSGTLDTGYGGTGLSTVGTGNQVLGVIGAGGSLEYKTISAGTGISVTPGANVITIGNTGVTSVGLSLPSNLLTVTVSPITTTGTLTATLTTQNNSFVFAGPVTGGPLTPAFRLLTLPDLANALQLYTESPSTPTPPSAIGANSVAIGSGSVASAVGSFAEGAGANARIFGQKAYANGSFAAAGDAQHGVYVLRASYSASATWFELFLDGVLGTERLVLPDNSLFTFDILVAGRRTDATSQGAGYRFVGVAKKDAAGTIAFIGTPSKTIIGETITAWDARITADTATDSIMIETRGPNGVGVVPIRWVATVTTSEVTF